MPGGRRSRGVKAGSAAWFPGRSRLDEALALLEEVKEQSLWEAIGRGAFADVKRTRTGGKGHAGVVPRHAEYLNPILEALEKGAK